MSISLSYLFFRVTELWCSFVTLSSVLTSLKKWCLGEWEGDGRGPCFKLVSRFGITSLTIFKLYISPEIWYSLTLFSTQLLPQQQHSPFFRYLSDLSYIAANSHFQFSFSFFFWSFLYFSFLFRCLLVCSLSCISAMCLYLT